jgi:lipopolysaccharide biosynthesis glycosyltransferase
VPWLQNWKGWAIFIDGDMVLRDDITKLWNLRDDDKAIMVVKHNYQTRRTQKYLGAPNENYPRKNWSSVILWNCADRDNQMLTPDFVQSQPGSYLHRFSWIDDHRIGSLPIEWNWLPDELGPNDQARLLHYTLGTPCFNEFTNTAQADVWHQERFLTNYCQQKSDL